MTTQLTKAPAWPARTFLDFPFEPHLDELDAHIAILGVPYGLPYFVSEMANDQSRAPDAIRSNSKYASHIRDSFDWDLNGPLLDNKDIKVVDCGNVTADKSNHQVHYQRVEEAARNIYTAGATLITLGGDHGVSIPVMRALESIASGVTLVHIDAHLDWRTEANGVTEGFRSPIRRAYEMPWINKIVQIGIRGNGSLSCNEVNEVRANGADIITTYEMNRIGIQAVLERIPENQPIYLSIDADGLDPSIMPAVIAQTPGGLTWLQAYELIHGLVRKGRILGMDLVEIAPSHDVGNITLVHAERLLVNFIGACVQAGYYDA